MDEPETIKVTREGGLVHVLLNRPEKKNAINRQMHTEIQELCRELADDFEARVVIFSGAGDCFSSGADTSEWRVSGSANELEVRDLSGIGGRTSDAIDGLNQISIAAVHGFAIGGGVVLAASCDMRVAGRSTWFSIPEVELGLPLGWSALPRLAREMGHSRTLELTVTCERFDAVRAHEYGLVTHLVEDGEAESVARDLADRILAQPALPVALTKATMKAIKKGSELGQVSYADGDLLLYARLMAQRAARLEKEGRGA
jgi:enoyl-CoA hydratase/carnithine racemase